MAWVIFAAILLITLIGMCGLLIILMARTLLCPRRMTDARATWILQRVSPADVGLAFADMRFDVRDEQSGRSIQLAAWWIPSGDSDRTIVLIHGYADAKIGAMAWAPTLHAIGWNILAVDLRAHGESEGLYSTAGFFERHDLSQIINQLCAQQPGRTRSVAIFGVSLGAAVAVATAAMRDDISAIVLESPFADYRRAIAAHGRMRGLPGGFMRDAAIQLAEWMAHADFRAVRPEALLKDVKCPVMLIHAGNDSFIPDDDATAMDSALKARNNPDDVLWSVPNAAHVLGLAAETRAYRQRLEKFLGK